MNWRNTKHHYGALSMALHWAMLLLIAAVYASIELRGFFPKGSGLRQDMKTWHFMLGLSVLLLAMLRLAVALTSTVPRIQPEPARWQHRLARLAHFALYGLMFGMPLLGWLALSAQGKSIPFFGMQLPQLVAENRSLADWAEDIHEAFGSVGYALIGVHAAAALFHHYLIRDNTLRRMLPWGRTDGTRLP
ncbi:cytochrome b [Acidovorax sp. LjRoot118]|uniref:cytochrome b n=1 Tax=unclassified Acidovorax TaxID=2684926 RepID=UPI00070CB15F|nr:cytochrome b [Acidovorax sp. Root219]KRC17003.1 cytochrome B [Acidovorax sp. Root219]